MVPIGETCVLLLLVPLGIIIAHDIPVIMSVVE